MSFLQQASYNNHIDYTQRDATSSATIIESSSIAYVKQFQSGTGVSALSQVYYTSGTLLSGQNLQVDLMTLQRQIFGATQNITFSGGKVKTFYLENAGSGTISLVNSGNSAFPFNFLGASSGINLWPTGYFSCTNLTGWSVLTGQRYFGLINREVFAQPYEIAILGN